jgi:hypothetical protein
MTVRFITKAGISNDMGSSSKENNVRLMKLIGSISGSNTDSEEFMDTSKRKGAPMYSKAFTGIFNLAPAKFLYTIIKTASIP